MRINPLAFISFICLALAFTAPARAGDESAPLGEPALEPPTLHCLGAYWIVRGDDDKDAAVAVEYRPAGSAEWRQGPPLFRIEKGAHPADEFGPPVDVPAGAWLFAGSVFFLQPDTEYELRLRLSDPDGGEPAEKILIARTRPEPTEPPGQCVYHVVPGDGGGSGTEADPYRGLLAARTNSAPGTTFLLHAGVYDQGTLTLNPASKSGQPGKPVVWRAAGDGEVVLHGGGAGKVIEANGVHDVFFEGLTLRNAGAGITLHDAARVVVRRCHVHGVEFGVVATRNAGGALKDLFIADNVIEGPSTWPRAKGIESARGVQVTGTGHVVCYNRIRGFADAINTYPSAECSAIDFHNNDVSELTDDGVELDYARRNVRCFHNRLTNVFQGVSLQPSLGGPVYVLRNAAYNVVGSPLKLHGNPSGGLFVHNTFVRRGEPFFLSTPEQVRNCYSRNNLFAGTAGTKAVHTDARMVDCDFDYDGFAGGPFEIFVKWNGEVFESLDRTHRKAPVYRHALLLGDPAALFAGGGGAGGIIPDDPDKQFEPGAADLRLRAGTAAVDAGQTLAGFNDGYAGAGPDLGAYESGHDPPHYGPRPAKQ